MVFVIPKLTKKPAGENNRDAIEITRRDNEKIKERIKSMQEKYDDLLNSKKRKSEELDVSLEATKSMFIQKKTKLNEIISQQLNVINSLEETSQKITSSESSNDLNIQNLIIECQQEIQRLQKSKTNINLAITEVNNQINELEKLIDLIPFENDEILDLAKKQIQHHINSEVLQLQIKMTNAQNHKKEFEDEIQLAVTINDGYKQENIYFQSRIEKFETEIKELNNEINVLQTEYEKLLPMISFNDLESSLKRAEKETKDEIAKLNTEIGTQINEIQNKNNDLSKELEERCNAIEILNGKINELVSDLNEITEKKEKEIKKLKEKHQKEIEMLKNRIKM